MPTEITDDITYVVNECDFLNHITKLSTFEKPTLLNKPFSEIPIHCYKIMHE